jgi:hypothetical protein
VYQIPLQAAIDLENTVKRLHSDAGAPKSGKPSPAASTSPAVSHQN